MPMPSVAESGRLVQPCAACGRFEASLLAPADLVEPARHICEVCADPGDLWRQCDPYGPAPASKGFVWVDLAFLDLVAPLLGAVEFRSYLAISRLCDGHRGASSLSKLAAAAVVSRRNVVDAVALLERVGLVAKILRGGSKGSRYLIVRPHVIHRGPDVPCLVRGGVYVEAAAALAVIRGSSRGGPAVIRGSPEQGSGDHQASDLGITAGLSLCPDQIPQTNQLAMGSPPTHPRAGRNGANAPCSLAEQAAESAAGAWPAYRRRVVAEVSAGLVGWAEQAGEGVTVAQLSAFLRNGVEQTWLQRGVEQGRIASALHVWCDQERWIRWLGESNRRARCRAERDRGERMRDRPTAERLQIAREAAALARGAQPRD